MKNYLIFSMKYLNVTQNYNGKTSHYPYSTGDIKNYPLDLAGGDSGRDWFYCPCDAMKVERIYGVGNKGVNTLWLTSTTPCIFADGIEDYATIVLTHPEDDDLKKLKVGQIFKRGDKICREGGDGGFTNHIHLAVGRGKITNGGWTQNNKGKWVLTTTKGPLKPEKAFFLDKSFTTVKKTGNLIFKNKPLDKKYKTTAKLNVRKGTSTKYDIVEVLDKGKTVTVIEIFKNSAGEEWAQINKGYVLMKYLKEA